MTNRELWRQFICDPSRAGRYLSHLGGSMQSSTASRMDADVLSDFLKRLDNTRADAELLADAVDLSDGVYLDFCHHDLPQIISALSSETASEGATVGPALRGIPRWGPTEVARRSGRILSSQFIVRLSVRSAAVPENIVVRWLLSSLLDGAKRIEARLGSGALPQKVAAIQHACLTALCDERLASIVVDALPPTPQMLLTAERHRLPGYRKAAKIARRRMLRVCGGRDAKWLQILDLLSANWLEPINDDDLFELFSMVVVLDVLEHEVGLGAPVSFGLVVRERDYIARFIGRDGSVVRVYFDQSPVSFLGIGSRYQTLLSLHEGPIGAARRPDVAIVKDDGGKQIALLVEAKRSSDRGYAADSVYKAMGYISDFSDLWTVGAPKPNVVLLFPENIRPKTGVSLKDLEVVLLNCFDRQILADAIATRLGYTVTSSPVGSA